MTTLALPTGAALAALVNRTAKRTDVEALIADYVRRHQNMDVWIGLAGFAPIPGAGLASMVAAVAVQAPIVYQPMAKDIAAIYGRMPDGTTLWEVGRGGVGGGLLDIAADFGVEFFKEIGMELVQEAGLGGLLSIIPIVGGAVSIVLDRIIAKKMTWRVGMMIALYYENGCKWVGSRKATYELVSRRLRGKAAEQPTIEQVVKGASTVTHEQEASVTILAQMLLDTGVSKEEVRERLCARGVDPTLVDAVMKRF